MQPNPVTAAPRRSWLVAVALFGGLALAACGGQSGDANQANAPRSNVVVMKLIALRPAHISVPAGETVTWRQTDAGVHTVTSGLVHQQGGSVSVEPDGKFDSHELATDETFSFTFADPGAYPYFCEIHPATMRGDITVT